MHSIISKVPSLRHNYTNILLLFDWAEKQYTRDHEVTISYVKLDTYFKFNGYMTLLALYPGLC